MHPLLLRLRWFLRAHCLEWVLVALLLISGCTHTTSPRGSARQSSVAAPDAGIELTFAPLDFSGEVHVDFHSRDVDYGKLAVMPFKCAVEIAGQSVPDIVTTELFKTAKYQLIERGQIQNILKEQEFRLSGVIDESEAAALGRVLGVQGVVIGTISEYGLQKRGVTTVPSVGMSIRMIDSTTGKIVWSVSHSRVGQSNESLSQAAQVTAEEMVQALSRAWIDIGDRLAPGLPPPRTLTVEGGVREVKLAWPTHSSNQIAGYEIQRRNPGAEDFVAVKRLANRHGTLTYTDTELLDLTLYTYRVLTVSQLGLISVPGDEHDVVTQGPPKPPVGLVAQSGMLQSVELAWSVPDDAHVAGYVVKRREAGVLGEIARLDAKTSTRYLDQGVRGAPLEDGRVYGYVVISLNKANVESVASDEVHAKTLPPPSAVRGLRAKSGLPRSVVLEWEENPDSDKVDGYKVLRAASEEGPFVEVGRVNRRSSTTYTDANRSSMKDAWTYYYQVYAYNRQQSDGALCEAVAAVTKPAPKPPSGVRASQGEVKAVDVQWRQSPDAAVATYRIYRATGESGRSAVAGEVDAATLVYRDEGLADGQSYSYQIASVDADALESSLTEPVVGSTKPVPPAPQADCRVTEDRLTLSWTHDDPDSIALYAVYELSWLRRKKIHETADQSFEMPIAAGERKRLVVTAIGTDGLESEPSEEISGQRARQ